MREFNKDIQIVSYSIGEVDEKKLNLEIYRKMVEDLGEWLIIEPDYKMQTIDTNASESYLRELKPDWMDYKSVDKKETYIRDGEDIKTDFVGDANSIPVKPKSIDLLFVIGSKFGFGQTHNAIFEAERIMHLGGHIIVSLSKYLYYKELLQTLLGYRAWEYIRAIEVNYKIIESGIESAKFFCYYRFKG